MRPDTLDNNQPRKKDELLEYDIETPKTSKKSGGPLSGGKGVVLGIGIGVLLTFGATRFLSRPQAPKSAAVEAKTTAPARTVTTTTVTTRPVERTLTVTGTVNAYESIPVLSQALGLQIQQILADEGDTITRGQLLARLDSSVLEAQLNQAIAGVNQERARLAELKAGARKEEVAGARETVKRVEAEIRQATGDLDLARKRLQRNRTLEAEGAIARDRLDEAINEERNKEAELQQAKARLGEAQQQLARLQAGNRPEVIAQAEARLAEARSRQKIVQEQLNDTKILSPVNGTISERNARVGDTTNGQTALFRIIENGRLELRASVPETRLSEIGIGSKVVITSDADRGLKRTGTVREIEPVVNETSRQAIVKIDIDDSRGLRPGMFLRGAIVTNTIESLTVPLDAVLPKNNNNATVYTVNPDNTVTARAVVLGQIFPDKRVEILSGLNAGDRIAVKGAAYLGDGDKITEAGNL